MTIKAAYSTPLLIVADVSRSIKFYEMLGFELIDDDASENHLPGWARVHCQGGGIMFLADEDNDASARESHDRFMITLYTPDLPALREQLVAAGVAVSEIKRPAYMPSGEMYFNDPDGFRIHICHWGEAEDKQWMLHLEKRKKQRAGESGQPRGRAPNLSPSG